MAQDDGTAGEGLGDGREGLYAIVFRTRIGEGSGVVVLQDGRFRGGDSRMAYHGRYRFSGDMFSADLVVTTHFDRPGMVSTFGPDRFTLALHGNFAAEPISLIAVSPEVPGVEMRATLRRIAE